MNTLANLRPEQQRRSARWVSRAAVARECRRRGPGGTCDTWRRVAGCGRALGSVDLHFDEATRSAYPVGVATCGSVWSCEVCRAKISARRAADVTFLASWHARNGGVFQLITLTIAHQRSDDLGRLVKGQTAAWRRVQRSAWWAELRATLPGFVRSLEVTFGMAFGFHPHQHVLLLVAGDAELVKADELLKLWRAAVLAELGPAHVPDEHGVDVRFIRSAEYVAKISKEVTLSAEKHSSRDVFYCAGRGWWDKFDQHARAMKGHRAVQWSRGLRAACGLSGAEPTDDELAAADVAGVRVHGIPARTWNKALRAGWAVLFLERCEAGETVLRLAG